MDRVRAWHPLLEPTYMQRARSEIDLVPVQIDKLGRTQAMPIRDQDHSGVAMTPAVLPSRVHQPINLCRGQILAGSQLAVRWTFRGNCSIYSGWCNQLQVPFCHVLQPLPQSYCVNKTHFSNS